MVEIVYRALGEKCNAVFESMNADAECLALFTKTHNYQADFALLGKAIDDRFEEKLYGLAVKEYEFALLGLATGNYRGAFSGLRLSYELILAGIYFSAHEIDYRLWSKQAKDIYWNVITNAENGIFSAVFTNAFNVELQDERKHFQTLATSVYRECSEYVHGNAHTHIKLPTTVMFDKDVVKTWCDIATTMHLVITFGFALRHIEFLPKAKLESIEHIMLEYQGHLPSIQHKYQSQN